MYCTNCGKENKEGAAFCTSCGKQLGSSNTSQASGSQTVYNGEIVGQPVYQPQLPMKWHNFVSKVSLILAAIFNFIGAIGFFTGAHYYTAAVGTGINPSDAAELIYSNFPTLKVVDVAFAIISLALGVFSLILRPKMIGFKSDALKLFFGMLAVSYVTTFVYDIACCIIIKSFNLSFLSSFAACVVYFVLNWIYYSKRKHLFVN